MAEVSNQKIIERYKTLLANRTHDVILRDAALEILEAEVKSLKDEVDSLDTRNRALNDQLQMLQAKYTNLEATLNSPEIIQGEVISSE